MVKPDPRERRLPPSRGSEVHPNPPRPDPPSLPPIILRASDAERLYAVALGALLKDPRWAGGLLDELRRASVAPDDQVDAEIAGVGSYVDYVDQLVAPEHVLRVQLVLPEAANGDEKLSVLSDFGAALLGLAPGQSIVWPDRRGGVEHLTVLAVQTPAAATLKRNLA
jgi:regulator of nucleoside diphosphate kinase